MKFDFWLDLPKALANILKEDMSKDDEEMLKSLGSTEELSNALSKISHLIDANAHSLNNSEMDILRQKLFSLQKEKTEILCKAIKFSTRLMSRILASIEQVGAPHKEVLIKIKMFLKITRMVVEQSKSSLEGAKSENENKFFSMIQAFSEKIQGRLVAISNNIIKSTLTTNTNERKLSIGCKQGVCPDLSLANTSLV